MPIINDRSGSTNCQFEEMVQFEAKQIVLQERIL